MKKLKIPRVTKEVEKEVNEILQYFYEEYGCEYALSEALESNPMVVNIDVTLLPGRQIFLPANPMLSVFLIDTDRQVMTLCYFPGLKDKSEVLAN